MSQNPKNLPGTLVWIAPFYNRSGYGVGARAVVTALHKAGVPIRVVSVNEIEPGIDDSDMDLIKSLENTPIIPPITTIISHVPSKSWLDIKLPGPNMRIMATTFDSSAQGNLPPKEWLEVFEEIDQIWLNTYKEQEVFISAGVPAEKIQIVHFPHPWKDNDVLPAITPEKTGHAKPFRFLSIAMFLPRRRWDTLIESYLEEFKAGENVELYLKVNYPSWHPSPGKPGEDLYDLIDSLRIKTRSNAPILIDEELGTRTGIAKIIDSCNTYISTDTAPTASVAEARVRHRLVIVPRGIDSVENDVIQLEIEVDPAARFSLTEDMLLYQPHHKDTLMPQLHVKDVKHALRSAFNLSLEERQSICQISASHIPGPKAAIPRIIDAINAGWEYKKIRQNKNFRIIWEGSQFVYHSLALINRELCLKLIDAGYDLSIILHEQRSFGPEVDTRFHKLSDRFNKKLNKQADVHVRHQWPPNLTPPPEGHWVIIQPWEFGSLPKRWVETMRTQMDEIWVPSKYVRECYICSGIPADQVCVVPNGVDTDKFRPDAPPLELKSKRHFKFLFVGGTIGRKGIDILLDVYTKTFTIDDDVCLVIKDMGGQSFYKGQTAAEKIRQIQAKPDAPEILYMTDDMQPDDLPGLYTACDCLVHPYRGEGFGLPIAEAMACSLPVIVTGQGAALDFCSEKTAYLIPAREVRLSRKQIGDLETVDYPWLAEPDRQALKHLMQHVITNHTEARAKGEAARACIQANFTWEQAAETVQKRLIALGRRPIRRFATADDLAVAQESVTQILAAGQAALERDDLEAALREFKQVTGQYPDLAAGHAALGSTLVALERTAEAIPALRRAIELAPQAADLQNQLGVALYQADAVDAAEAAFRQAQQADPQNAQPLLNLIDLYRDQERYVEATDLAKEAITANPNHAEVLVTFGILSLELGVVDGAQMALKRLRANQPEHPGIIALEQALEHWEEKDQSLADGKTI